jgi:hypothetical protein
MPTAQAVREMTQAEYAAHSKGTYSRYETYYLRAGGVMDRCSRDMYIGSMDKLPPVCKIRGCYGSSDAASMYAAKRVIVLIDKPQADLPDWATVQQAVAAEATA